MKKKLLVMILAFSLGCGGLAGCGSSETAEGQVREESGSAGDSVRDEGNSEAAESDDGSEGSGAENNGQTEGGDSVESSVESESGGEAESVVQGENGGESRYEIPDVTIKAYDIPDTEGMAFVHNLKIGWNLGNTLDAYSESSLAHELDSETYWGNPTTTKQMLDDIYEAGFNSVRIPVSWHPHVDEDYRISEEWMNRVQEITDYAYDNGMYVILNIHHDNSQEFMYPSSQYLEQSIDYVTTIWQQVAERFADYDEHLIFECMNEPRQVGTDWEWWMNGSDECNDAVACINEINQAFVNTVRATGGNNRTRFLMVPGYDASPEGALDSGFVLPQDAEGVEDRLIVSVHAYKPYSFALQAPGESGSTAEFDSDIARYTSELGTFMNQLYDSFISKGIPVVIDEFGSRDKEQNIQARIDHAAYYVAAARARGISCFWWDNNVFSGSGENFGLYDRNSGSFPYPELVEGMMKYAD